MKLSKLCNLTSVVVVFWLLCGANTAFAQCGLPGTAPCPTAPKNPTPAPKTPAPKNPTLKDNNAKPKAQPRSPARTTVACKVDPVEYTPVTKTQTINGVDFEFVSIPAGSFCMGENSEFDDEKPVHKVTITKGFWMGKYEITRAQWKAVMGSVEFGSCYEDNCPYEEVSWVRAQNFISKLNQLGEGIYSLPTEAEWEYACRAGSTTKYGYGDDPSYLKDYAWYKEGERYIDAHPVGQKLPNKWDLYDMHGNVGEWVQDWLGNYPASAVTDPKGAANGDHRVIRGGSKWSDATRVRSAFRAGAGPSIADYGLRIVMR